MQNVEDVNWGPLLLVWSSGQTVLLRGGEKTETLLVLKNMHHNGIKWVKLCCFYFSCRTHCRHRKSLHSQSLCLFRVVVYLSCLLPDGLFIQASWPACYVTEEQNKPVPFKALVERATEADAWMSDSSSAVSTCLPNQPKLNMFVEKRAFLWAWRFPFVPGPVWLWEQLSKSNKLFCCSVSPLPAETGNKRRGDASFLQIKHSSHVLMTTFFFCHWDYV